MKVLEKSAMPNGIEIQLEDWSDKDTGRYPNLYGLQIGAYPYARNTGKYRWIENRRVFRLTISTNKHNGYSNEHIRADFEALKSGAKQLEDLSEHFWNKEKDMWYLGMDVAYLDSDT